MGSLGVFVAARPFAQRSIAFLTSTVEFRTMFLLTVSLFVFLILAYYSNPTETSFRSYLTEQSFRHHLSRLHDANDGDLSDSDDSGVHYTSRRSSTGPPSRADSLDTCASFPFSNRALVALRTPTHAFHSFAFFTIAAVIPNNAPTRSTSPSTTSRSSSSSSTAFSEIIRRTASADGDLDGASFKESWFIGAFGRWWRGGVIEASWPPSESRAKCDEEGWSSGILDIKALDKSDSYNGLPFPTTASPRSPPKLRSRDRSAPRSRRSSTPPPLPKSATLPLHTPKQPPPPTSLPKPSPVPTAPPLPAPLHSRTPSSTNVAALSHSPCPSISSVHSHTSTPAATPSSLPDTHPAITELLAQIAHARSQTHDLRAQLAEHASSAGATDAALSTELRDAREAKRAEDAARGEVKGRLKTLEEARRAAEAGRREAERRLRAAQNARADAAARAAQLSDEIGVLEAQICRDREAVAGAREGAEREVVELTELLERRKKEISVAEGVVAALGARVKTLETRVEEEQERLKGAQEHAELLKQDRRFLSMTVVKSDAEREHALPPLPHSASDTGSFDSHTFDPHAVPHPAVPDIFPTPAEKDFTYQHVQPQPRDSSAGVRSRDRSRSPQGNLLYSSPEAPHPARAKGYAIFDDDIASLAPKTTFAPFGDDADLRVDYAAEESSHGIAIAGGAGHGQNAFSAALLPNGLFQSLEGQGDALPKSFQSESDAFLARDWRRPHALGAHSAAPSTIGSHSTGTSTLGSFGSSTTLNSSPVALVSPAHSAFPGSADEEAYDAFEVRPREERARHRLLSDPAAQRGWPLRTHSDPPPPAQAQEKARHWWSASTGGAARRRGLNPDAKEFRLSPAPAPAPAPQPQQASTLFARAFAPSPAERAALQRALGSGGSAERLPPAPLLEFGVHPQDAEERRARTWGAPREFVFSPWADGEGEE